MSCHKPTNYFNINFTRRPVTGQLTTLQYNVYLIIWRGNFHIIISIRTVECCSSNQRALFQKPLTMAQTSDEVTPMSKSTELSKDHSLTSNNFEKNDHSITSIDFAERFTNKLSTEDNKWRVHNNKFVTFVSDFPHKLGCTMSCELSREKKKSFQNVVC